MGGCCEPSGHQDTFGARFSHRMARRYRRRGLDPRASRMVELLDTWGLQDATVLEIGGGVGAIQVELLRRGAARATNLELVDSYESDAALLAAEAGVGDRVTRHQLDLALHPDAVDVHDVVILHRVVCCYPDYEALLGAAAGRATRVLIYSHPPRTLLTRALCRAENLFSRVRGSDYRAYVHDPAAMGAVVERGGMHQSYHHRRGMTWHISGFTAPASA